VTSCRRPARRRRCRPSCAAPVARRPSGQRLSVPALTISQPCSLPLPAIISATHSPRTELARMTRRDERSSSTRMTRSRARPSSRSFARQTPATTRFHRRGAENAVQLDEHVGDGRLRDLPALVPEERVVEPAGNPPLPGGRRGARSSCGRGRGSSSRPAPSRDGCGTGTAAASAAQPQAGCGHPSIPGVAPVERPGETPLQGLEPQPDPLLVECEREVSAEHAGVSGGRRGGANPPSASSGGSPGARSAGPPAVRTLAFTAHSSNSLPLLRIPDDAAAHPVFRLAPERVHKNGADGDVELRLAPRRGETRWRRCRDGGESLRDP